MLHSSAQKLRRVEPGEDGMPLVEKGQGQGVGQGSLCRTTSCIEDPQGSALTCLKHGDLRQLSDILSELGGNLNLNHGYPEENFKTLLQIGVETGDINAVQILLRAGAEPGRVNPVLKTSAVHAAAGQARPDILKALVDYSGPECMNVLDRSGRIPLHLAVLACKKNPDKGFQCVKMCIDHGSNINCLDRKGGQTPLYLAASEQCLPVLKLLLEQGADASIPCQGMSTRQLITDSFSAAEVEQLDLSSVTESAENSFDELLRLVDIAELDGPDDPKFRKALNKASIREIDSSTGSVKKSLVQLCAERGLDSYLKLILEKGGDPNTTTPSESATPLILAAKSGFGGILKVLLEENNLLVNGSGEASRLKRGSRVDVYRTDSTGSTVLHNVLRKPFYALDTSYDEADYGLCLQYLLAAKVDWSKIINKQDVNGNTPLHYAVQFWDQETVTKLLLLGANIGLKNILGEAPISSILPETMEDFLNNHCISSKGNPTNDDFRITFKYDFLAPPRESLPRQLRAETSMNKLGSSAADECLEEGQDDGTTHPETEVLWYMAGSKEHRYLLKHPVITSFLSLKWGRISYHYNSNLLFYTLLVGVLTSYIFANYGGQALGVQPPFCPNQTNSSGSHGNSLNSYQSGLWWTLLVLIILLGIREVFQFCISAARYFHSVENIIEVALVLSVGLLLGYGAPGCHVQMKRELSSAALMFSWIELVTMVGRHPILTTYNTYLTMFYRVLKTFLQFLAWYSLFLLAFSLSFYILLHSNQDEESEYIYFDHIGLTIVKICSMFIGELEFSDLPLSSAYSYIFFLIFIFLIVVVLMNLLNGLAVSDTGLIREDAEIHSHVCRVEVISAAEATILGDPAHILTGPGKLFPTCGLRRKLGAMFRTRTVLQRILGGTGVMLFYSVLPDKQLVIYPNRKSLLCSPCLSSKEVGREIVDSAKNLVLRLSRDNQEKQGWEQAIKEIRLKQESLEEKMDRVLVKLENISNSLKL